VDLFDIETLFPQLVAALGFALIAGNGLALVQHYRGKLVVEGDGQIRKGRAWFLIGVGVILTIWGAVTLFTSPESVAG